MQGQSATARMTESSMRRPRLRLSQAWFVRWRASDVCDAFGWVGWLGDNGAYLWRVVFTRAPAAASAPKSRPRSSTLSTSTTRHDTELPPTCPSDVIGGSGVCMLAIRSASRLRSDPVPHHLRAGRLLRHRTCTTSTTRAGSAYN